MSDRRPLVVIAPDSYKGSCPAADAARALARGVRLVFGEQVTVIELPLADGGEGTLDALTSAWTAAGRSVEILTVAVTDALGRERTGRIGLVGSRENLAGRSATHDAPAAPRHTAIIEAAEANGLPHVADVPLCPLDADTHGVGLLARAALDAGATEILLCIGGSATSDGGAGMLSALGARMLDTGGQEVAPGGRGLASISSIDLSGLHPAARSATWRIAVDVTNPLIGPDGAAAVFGPQKGANDSDVEAIEAGLTHWAEMLAPKASTVFAAQPGMGAAGGIATGLVALFGAELVPGAELVAQAVELDASLAKASLVITGEGRLDAQSLSGKVASRILQGTPTQTPVVAIVGSLALTAAECRAAGLTAAFSIAQGPCALDELVAHTPELLENAAAQACALLDANFATGSVGLPET